MFDKLLGWLARHFTLTDLEGSARPAPRPKVVLSFDDGYRDFPEVAMPILARHGVRANQNVISRCVETGLPPLNVLAADFLGKAPPERVAALTLPGLVFGDAKALWPRLDAFLENRSHAEQEAMGEALLPRFLPGRISGRRR